MELNNCYQLYIIKGSLFHPYMCCTISYLTLKRHKCEHIHLFFYVTNKAQGWEVIMSLKQTPTVIYPGEVSVSAFISAPHILPLSLSSHSTQITSVYQCLSSSVTCTTQQWSLEVHHVAQICANTVKLFCSWFHSLDVIEWLSWEQLKFQTMILQHPSTGKWSMLTFCRNAAGILQCMTCVGKVWRMGGTCELWEMWGTANFQGSYITYLLADSCLTVEMTVFVCICLLSSLSLSHTHHLLSLFKPVSKCLS